MKKVNALLHDVTIINFSLVARLTLRYRWASFLTILTLIFSIVYIYTTQVTIHSKKVYFKIYSQIDSTGGGKKFSDLMGELTSSFMNQGEVGAIISNYDFTYALADKIVSSPQFELLDFSAPLDKQYKSHAEIFRTCPDKICRIKTVQAMVPKLYVLDTELGTGRFVLTVATRSVLTTLEVVQKFQVTLNENRYLASMKENEEQIKQVQQLIDASRAGIAAKGGFASLGPQDSMDALILFQHDKIRGLTQKLSAEVDQYHYQQIRLKQSEVTANKDIKGSNKLEFANYSKVAKRVDTLRQNIASMNSTPPESRTETDISILNQLVEELKQNELELKKAGRMRRNISQDDKFIDSHISNQSNFEFDYNVAAAKVKKLQSEVANAKQELSNLHTKKAKFESEHLTLKPDLEYLKLMESKMVSLKMLRTTIKSDVIFDQFGFEVNSFKRNSLLQIVLFSFLLSSFILFNVLIVIYLFDDRIHDEYEIMKCCENLPIIGSTPTFEKNPRD